MKDVVIIEAHSMPEHIHMLVKIPPKKSVSYFMEFFKEIITFLIVKVSPIDNTKLYK